MAAKLSIPKITYIKKENGKIEFTFEECLTTTAVLNGKLRDIFSCYFDG